MADKTPPPKRPFEKHDDIKAWLNTQPKEICVVFAARAALRAIPMLDIVRTENSDLEFIYGIILPSFRAMASALSAGAWPQRAAAYATVAASAAAAATSIHFLNGPDINAAARANNILGDAAAAAGTYDSVDRTGSSPAFALFARP